MRAHYFHLYLLGSMCVPSAYPYRLSPVESQLRDLVTQNSVITRARMVEVIRNYRDGTILPVEWLSLIETAIELDRASELLTWYMDMLDQVAILKCKYFFLL